MTTTSRFGAELQHAMDQNLATHMSWIVAGLPTMHVEDTGDLLLVDSGLPCNTFNVITRARLTPQAAPGRVHEAIAHFARVQRPFSWWVGPGDRPETIDAHLRDAGLVAAEAETGMAMHLEELAAEPADTALRIERATTPAQLHDYATVVAANWSPPDPDVIAFYRQAAAVVCDAGSPLHYFVGYLDDEPVASAELCIAAGVAGLYSIATRAAFRRRGFGSAITLAPLLAARDLGVEVAVLQASGDGLPVYARLGFSEMGQYIEYQPA